MFGTDIGLVLRGTLQGTLISFLIVLAFQNYYRNNLHKRKNNWFWSSYEEESEIKNG